MYSGTFVKFCHVWFLLLKIYKTDGYIELWDCFRLYINMLLDCLFKSLILLSKKNRTNAKKITQIVAKCNQMKHKLNIPPEQTTTKNKVNMMKDDII